MNLHANRVPEKPVSMQVEVLPVEYPAPSPGRVVTNTYDKINRLVAERAYGF